MSTETSARLTNRSQVYDYSFHTAAGSAILHDCSGHQPLDVKYVFALQEAATELRCEVLVW
jgi:hypothetical protein